MNKAKEMPLPRLMVHRFKGSLDRASVLITLERVDYKDD
jgi:hypothetical protein